jgi:hypothetical protein
VIQDHLAYEEDRALELILRHHFGDNFPERQRKLKRDLATLINWCVAVEATKGKFSLRADEHPPFLLVLLGQMGIYNKQEVEKS